MDQPDLVGTALEKILGPITDRLKDVFEPGAKEAGLMIQDHIRFFRAKRQYKLLQKMAEFVKQAKFEPKDIPYRILLPSLDYASVEDDENLHTAWAALLANAADPASDEVPPAFPEILRQLAPRDALLLSALCDRAFDSSLSIEREHSSHRLLVLSQSLRRDSIFFLWATLGFSKSGHKGLTGSDDDRKLAPQRAIDEHQCEVSVGNLERLGLVVFDINLQLPVPTVEQIEHGTLYSGQTLRPGTEQRIRITPLGYDFLQVCTPPSKRAAVP